ncbi:TolC family protein [Alteromonas gracilis]|uniref:TolC family protein n=1 Tax=Alteromonas gracilis TaxID=1479524 RepID=UPI0030CE4AAF
MNCVNFSRAISAVRVKTTSTLAVLALFSFNSVSAELSLQQAQELAIANDPLLKGNNYRQQALRSDQTASDFWANPQLSTSVQNLPTDGFSLNQEPMTQVKIGIKQQLPRGDVNTLNREKLAVMEKEIDVNTLARIAWLKKSVALVWLDWYNAHERVRLLEEEERLLKQLMDITESRYSQGLGKAQQSDILQVRLAQLTLEDKKTIASQSLDEAHAALSEFYGAPIVDEMAPNTLRLDALVGEDENALTAFYRIVSDSEPFTLFQRHPEALSVQMKTQAQEKQVEIAREQTKSQWSVEASYGYRQDAQNGTSRADFLSVGVQVDLPYFTQPKQNADIAAALSRVNALKTDFRLKVNALASQAEVLKARLSSLIQRKSLYQGGLTSEVDGLAQTLLTAYTSDTANFSDVIGALLRQVQIQDVLLSIQIEEAKTLVSLAYLYLPSIETQPQQHTGK